jgi:hypothetical protein
MKQFLKCDRVVYDGRNDVQNMVLCSEREKQKERERDRDRDRKIQTQKKKYWGGHVCVVRFVNVLLRTCNFLLF